MFLELEEPIDLCLLSVDETPLGLRACSVGSADIPKVQLFIFPTPLTCALI